MKNYEYFNKAYKDNQPAEVQAFEMMLANICNDFCEIKLKEDELRGFVALYKAKLEWLNQEKR